MVSNVGRNTTLQEKTSRLHGIITRKLAYIMQKALSSLTYEINIRTMLQEEPHNARGSCPAAFS